MRNAVTEVTTFIGSDIYSFSPESVDKPKGRKYLVGVFDFGASQFSGDIRHFYLTFEGGDCILWDGMVDGDVNGGKQMWAMVAQCRDYEGRKGKVVAYKLILESLKKEIELYSLECASAKLMKAGLMREVDFRILIEALDE
jgi:hypothetical protein